MPYTRFQAFLLIYVLLTAGVEKIELLNTQMTLWNTSRAIAAAMAIGAIEIGITPLLYIYKPGALNFSFFIFLAVQFALTGLAFAVSHSAYARVCSTLFALTYIVANKTPITIANAATG